MQQSTENALYCCELWIPPNRAERGFQVKFQFEVIAIVTRNLQLQSSTKSISYFCEELSSFHSLLGKVLILFKQYINGLSPLWILIEGFLQTKQKSWLK